MLNNLNFGLVVLILAGLTGAYVLSGPTLSHLLFKLGIRMPSARLFYAKTITIALNLALLALLGIRPGAFFHFDSMGTGTLIIALGASFSVAVAYATYGAITRGDAGQKAVRLFGTNSGASYSVLTTAVSAGLAEDLFFIGILQYTLAGYVGWLAVPIYLLVISSAHYYSVVQGLESKMEFTRMLPPRLGISLLIAISFQLTGSIIYGLFIHNFFNTCALGAFKAGYRVRNTTSHLYPDMAEI